MKHVVLIGLILASGLPLLRAGSVVPMSNGPEVSGKLTMGSTSIRVEGSSQPVDLNLPDILVADFSDTPFQLNFYSSSNDKGGQLPPNWSGQDIGPVGLPGSVTDVSGTFTVSGSGVPNVKEKDGPRSLDALYFVGQPWIGNGQWTAQIRKISTEVWETWAGIMLRDSLDPYATMFALGAGTASNGSYAVRTEAGKSAQGSGVPMELPTWIRLTRYETDIFAAISTDGKHWDPVGQNNFKIKPMANPWIGFFVDSRREKQLGKASFDSVSFTPAPSLAEVIPPGVILQSGSFLAGYFERLNFDPANPDAEGVFLRNGKRVSIPRSKIAAIIMLPTSRAQIAEMATHAGLLMKNGDIMDGDFDSINGGQVLINSVLLGITTYSRSEVRGCFIHPVQVQPANYTLRLRDGSTINGNGFNVDNSLLTMQEISNVNVTFSADEAAQFRAGPSFIQPLAELNWKATLPPPPAAPSASSTPAGATPAPPAPGPTAPAMVPNVATDDGMPAVQSWQGPNQEQVMETGMGTMIEFPLSGKFRAIGVRIALSSDSPPNTQMTVRVMADGREIGRTPPFKAGDQPRFLEISIQNPKTVTLEADSIYAGTKALFIDPIAIRDN